MITEAAAGTWKAEWAATPSLQVEFDTSDAYVAYRQAVSSGAVRCAGARTVTGASLGMKPVSMLDRG